MNDVPSHKKSRPETSERHLRLIDQIVGAKRLPVETISSRILIEEGKEQDPQPKAISDYEIADRLGEGGMGVVFDAKQNSLERNIALKVYRQSRGSHEETTKNMQQFAKEAYITAQLDHPNVVPVYALAKDERGNLFFTMKKVEGVEWKALLYPDRRPDSADQAGIKARAAAMTWRDHIDVLLKVMDAVGFAHSKAILHRDLKPTNVMIGEFGEVYVMDWGLAMHFDERNEYRDEPEGAKLQLAGTPRYMAPEMARCELKALCAATDIYLLGAVLFEICTGRPPHKGKKLKSILIDAINGRIEDPKDEESPVHMTPEMRRIIQKAMAPEMADRHASVVELRADLVAYLAHSGSIQLAHDTDKALDDLQRALLVDPAGDQAIIRSVSHEEAALYYGRLSECVANYRQALERWEANGAARQGLYSTLSLQVMLAASQKDLVLAEAQVKGLDSVSGLGMPASFHDTVHERARSLRLLISHKRRRMEAESRRAKRIRLLSWVLALSTLLGLAYIWKLQEERRLAAIETQHQMFEAAVIGRGEMIEQFLLDIERITAQYQEEASWLIKAPLAVLPHRTKTPAGRDGFYYDEDYYDPSTAPPDLVSLPSYTGQMSKAEATVVRAPWVQGPKRITADQDAARFARLAYRFSQVHATRGDDLKWSLAGSRSGLLIGFPGSGRYRNNPRYDPTKRPWFTVAIDAIDDKPRWGEPYVDASTQAVLISCMTRVIGADGESVGVVGVEVTLETVQQILLDFSRAAGRNARSLLIRSFEVRDAKNQGKPRHEFRVVIDTEAAVKGEDWEQKLAMPRIDDLDQGIVEYFNQVQLDAHTARKYRASNGRLFAHALLDEHDWVLLVTADRE